MRAERGKPPTPGPGDLCLCGKPATSTDWLAFFRFEPPPPDESTFYTFVCGDRPCSDQAHLNNQAEHAEWKIEHAQREAATARREAEAYSLNRNKANRGEEKA